MDEPKRCASRDIELDTLSFLWQAIFTAVVAVPRGSLSVQLRGNPARYPRNVHGYIVAFDLYGGVD